MWMQPCAEMTVVRRLVVVRIQQLPQFPQVGAKPVRSNRGVVPSFPSEAACRARRPRPRSGLADAPHGFRLGLGVKTNVRGIRESPQTLDKIAGALFGSAGVIRAELRRAGKPRPSGIKSRFGAPFRRSPSIIAPSKPSRPIGLRVKNLGNVIRGGKRVAISEADERAVLRAGNQP